MENTKPNAKEVNISYEALFELLRREKNRQELQRLNVSFLKDVAEYIREKKRIAEEQKHKHDLFTISEREKMDVQQQNLRRILRELYERREKKITEMALDGSRTTYGVIDTSAMLVEEKRMYDMVAGLFSKFRSGILLNLVEGNMPVVEADALEFKSAKTEIREAENICKTEESSKQEDADENNTAEDEMKTGAETSANTEEPKAEDVIKENVLSKIRFLHAVPRFVGESLEEYGPFEEGETAELPANIAKVIISKGRAEGI